MSGRQRKVGEVKEETGTQISSSPPATHGCQDDREGEGEVATKQVSKSPFRVGVSLYGIHIYAVQFVWQRVSVVMQH